MKKLFTLIMLTTLLFAHIVPVNAAPSTSKEDAKLWPKQPKVAAGSAIVMEASTGLILYSKNIHKANYPASTTKLMTTLLALENCSLNEIVSFSHEAVFGIERGSSHIGIKVGEELTMEQSLYGIMLESANEVSSAVAEHISGDIPSFAKLMNARAKELGCENTNFVNANGLFNEKHRTSAYDLALISKELLKHKEFIKINSSRSYVIPSTNITKEQRPLNNHHQMIKISPNFYEGCFGGKTGYTLKSRYNLATFANRENMDLICIIMNEDNLTDQYPDTKKLLDFGFESYKAYNIPDESSSLAFDSSYLFNTYNCLFCPDTTPIKISNTSKLILPKSISPSETVKTISYDAIPKDSNHTIGSISYTYGGKVVGISDITYNKVLTPKLTTVNIKKTENISFTKAFKRNLKPIIITIIVLVIAGLGSAYYFFLERPRLRRRKAYYERRKRTRETFDHDFMDFK